MMELGLALGWNLAWVHFWRATGDDYSLDPKTIVMIGPEQNCFCSLPEVTRFPDFASCVQFLISVDAWCLRLGEQGEGLDEVAPLLTAGEPHEEE